MNSVSAQYVVNGQVALWIYLGDL